MRSLLITVAMTLFVGTQAQAQSIYDKCIAAIETNDTQTVETLAATIRRLTNPGVNTKKGLKCLEEAYGVVFELNFATGKFVGGPEASALKEASNKKGKLLEKQRCLIRKGKALSDLMASLTKTISAENERLIGDATVVACSALHDDNPNEAILNPICREVFKNGFHPDIDLTELGATYKKITSEQVSTTTLQLTVEAEIAALDNNSGIQKQTSASKVKSLEETAFQTCE